MAGYKKNLKELQEHLEEGEEIITSCYGCYNTKSLGADTVKNGVLAVTGKRVILFGKRFSGYDLETFPLGIITAIEVSKGMLGKRINIKMSGSDTELKWIQQGDPDGVVGKVKARGETGTTKSTIEPSNDTKSVPDVLGQIKKLGELKESGLLSEEEFTKKKSEMLKRL